MKNCPLNKNDSHACWECAFAMGTTFQSICIHPDYKPFAVGATDTNVGSKKKGGDAE